MITDPMTFTDGVALRNYLVANGWTIVSDTGFGTSEVIILTYGTNARKWKIYYASRWLFAPTSYVDGLTPVFGVPTAVSFADATTIRIIKGIDYFVMITNNIWHGVGTFKDRNGDWWNFFANPSPPYHFQIVKNNADDTIWQFTATLQANGTPVAGCVLPNDKPLIFPVYAYNESKARLSAVVMPFLYVFSNYNNITASSLVYAEGKPHVISRNAYAHSHMFRDPEA